jgi:DNA helicase II / ATP-dependent DNA helicase PcrA
VIKRLKVSIEPRPTRARISQCKAKAQLLLDERVEQRQSKRSTIEQQEFSQVYEEYQKALTASDSLDYDDLLLRCAELLRAHPQCVSNIEAVLIDEFQDTNIVQLELMKLFSCKNKRVTIVGDPDQSIYGFRSAEIQNLTRMQLYYPETSVIHLEENYRSSAAVLRCAQVVIEQDIMRPNKRLRPTHCSGSFPVLRRLPSPHDEAKWIVAEIRRVKAMTGNLTTFSDYAILIRSAHLSLLIENALGKAGMPYRMVGGYRFFDRDEIRTLLDYLRTISQPNNNAALSAIINVPSRKIGDESLKELLRLADEKGESLWVIVQNLTRGNLPMKKKLTRPAEQNLCKLVALIREAKKRMLTVPAESTAKFLLELCIRRLAYKDYLRVKHPEDHENRWANVEELLSQATDVAESSSNAGGVGLGDSLPEIEGLEKQQADGNDEALANFLANITLSSDLQAKEDGQEQECITISTIHSAKGLEWPFVFIPAVYTGSIPHSRAEDTDEERRLLYVAMTRAQALLYLTCPLRQPRSDTETILSSFLPQKLHWYFLQLGPDITDEVVRDVALILRRSLPSQEELVKGLESLSERESSRDNLWPADGSAKPRQWWDFEEEATSKRKRVGMEVDKRDDLCILQNQKNNIEDIGTIMETTMTSSNSFTLASNSVGFSTAARHLELNPPRQVQNEPNLRIKDDPPDGLRATSKPKQGNAKVGTRQGSLANFFNRGTFGSTVKSDAFKPSTAPKPEPELPSYINIHAKQSSHNIPTAFTSHKISNQPAALKRPQLLVETSTGKRKQYGFLSSSPTREGTLGQPFEGSSSVQAEASNTQAGIHTSRTKSVTTLHTTSMDILQRQGEIGVRKTYGIRREMNGWEKRKNK